MRLSIGLGLLGVLLLSTPAFAEDAPPVGCVKVIPERCECVEREVVIPARMGTRSIPVYEDVEVPVFKSRRVPVYTTRRIPVYEDVEVPCWKVRRVPMYVTRKIPVFEDVEVPVFAAEKYPVTREFVDPCTGCVRTICTFDVKVVQCGTRIERRVCGFEEEQVECGWRPERYQDGTRTVKKVVDWKEEQVLCTWRFERYQDGTRTERRRTGVRTETYEICPAQTVIEVDRVTVPCRRVTVVPDGTEGAVALPGTTEVMTEAEFAAARR
ncbi:MAG: hypothetical protein QNJ98_14455 [Planctomycetota bacterium]|nr:hypothetical protein [Planctomycetota bacterium]